MATEFQSCPGCESFILADTYECPQCGHVLDEKRASANATSRATEEIKNQQMYDTCRSCGESVRSGLVRCWSCNSFMRKDLEERYKEMTAKPQPIIFSDIPKDERTELIPTRDRVSSVGYGTGIFDAEDDNDGGDGFTLQAGAEPEFELGTRKDNQQPVAEARKDQPAADQSAKDQPVAEQPVAPKGAEVAESQEPPKPETDVKESPVAPGDPTADDLFGLAMQDQRETKRKKRDKLQQSRKKRILLPCTACGGWIRVHEEQGGRTVRCGQCKTRLVVPMMKKKEKAAEGEKDAAAVSRVSVTWLDDVRIHIVSPTDVVLKPGSLQKTFETVDAAFHDSGLYLVKLAPPAKKSLFGKSADGPPATEEQRVQIRDRISKSGDFSEIPFGEIQSVSAEQISNVRLVQPVAEAHASMFAGVPVFGDGQIAIYLPLQLEENKQAFLSFPLSVYRQFSEPLQLLFGFSIGAEENGVPATEEFETLTCAVSDEKFDSLKGVEFYENDSAYELAVAGYICVTCGAAVSEEGRVRKKLGGAAGKGIAKAKCPKCSNKMGDRKALKISKAPGDEEEKTEEEEDVTEVLKPKAVAADKQADGNTAAAPAPTLSLDSIQGKWKMVSLGQNGDYSNPMDMAAHKIVFAIDGNKYTVTAGEDLQEQGTVTVDTAQTPPHLDQTVAEGADAGKAHLGIFRIVGGKLENCQGAFDQPRPSTFESEKDSTASLAVFERA